MNLADLSLLSSHCYIDGEWLGDPVNAVLDPATGEVLGHVPALGAADAALAIEAAGAAFPVWSKRPAKERAVLVRRWFDLIIANRDDLAMIITREQGKPLAEAKAEIDYAASFVEFFAEEARRVYGETIPSHQANARILTIRQPVGVVAAITPWNFPAAMITRKLAPAIAVGCTVVLKPASETPFTALALIRLAERAGIPKGVVNVLTGKASEIGAVLAEHPLVRAISFTGSTEVGKLLMRQAASTVKKVGLELGGNAPFIVFDDADLEAAVEGAMVAKFRNAGQTCVCANRLYVQDGIYDAFVARLTERVAAMKVGNGLEVGVAQGPLITARAVEKVEQHVTDAVAKGARVLTGGRRHALGGGFYEPTVLCDVTTEMVVTHEETFGPVAPVYRFVDEAEVIALANASPFGLAAYFYSTDLGRAWRVAEALDAGMVGVNSALLGVDVAPFGGVKESGVGREGSRHGVEEYLEIKYILMGGL